MKLDLFSIVLFYLKKYKNQDYIELDIALEYKKKFDSFFSVLNTKYEICNIYCDVINKDNIDYVVLNENVNELELYDYYNDLSMFVFICSRMNDVLNTIGLEQYDGSIRPIENSKIYSK